MTTKLESRIEQLRIALYDVIGLDHHWHGQESRATKIARAAILRDDDAASAAVDETFVGGYDDGLRQAERDVKATVLVALEKSLYVLKKVNTGYLVPSIDVQEALQALEAATLSRATAEHQEENDE